MVNNREGGREGGRERGRERGLLDIRAKVNLGNEKIINDNRC